MADELATVRARIRGVRQLDAVIGAMRGIAAAHAQQSRALLPGFRAYADVISEAIASALRLRDDMPAQRPRESRQARVVFCAEQGFVGGFVERLWDEIAPRPPATLLLVGSRTSAVAGARGIRFDWHTPMATRVEGIANLCIDIAAALYDIVSRQRTRVVEVVYPRWLPGEGLNIVCQSLLPLDERRFQTSRTSMPPLSTLLPDVLLADLAGEYVYASLCEAAIHAFAAESEARVAAMVRAHGKLQDMLLELHASEHRVRQDAITAELVELAGGQIGPQGVKGGSSYPR